MKMGEMQRKLSVWAEQEKEHRYIDLYPLKTKADQQRESRMG
jgi:hypothetical protein